MSNKLLSPVAIAVTAGLCWAVLDLLMRLASAYVDAPTSAVARLSGGAIVLFILNAKVFKRKIALSQLGRQPLLFAVAALNAIVAFALSFAIATTTLGDAVFLLYMEPVFAAALAYVLLGERFGVKTAASLALAVVGLTLIFQPTQGSSLMGNAAGLLAGLSFGGIVVVSRKISGKVDSVARTFWAFALGAIILAPFSKLDSLVSLPIQGWLVVAGMILFITAGFLLFNAAVTYLDATMTGISLLSEPLGATAFGWLAFGESYGLSAIAGFALVGAGGLLAAKASRKRRAAAGEKAIERKK
jgi:drug/metabolite transporter (DMT)-like permease